MYYNGEFNFIDSISFMPCSLSKLLETFGITSARSCNPHYFNTKEKLNYVGEIPDVSYYGADTSAKERADFLGWYEVRGLKSLITEAF